MMVLHDWLTSDAPRSNPRAQEAPAQQLLASLARIDAVGIHVQYVYYFWDTEQLALYYGERYLKSKMGRWMSRDPKKERHERNLYRAMANDSVCVTDPLGLEPTSSAPSSQGCGYCGPDMSQFLVDLINSAVDWRNAQPDKSLLANTVWLNTNAKLMNWFSTSGQYKTSRCPSNGACANTYWLCGECVHDHWIGNFMFGFMARLIGIPDWVADAGAQYAQGPGPGDDPTQHYTDPPWDKAGYTLARNLFDDMETLPIPGSMLCMWLKADPDGAWARANDTSATAPWLSPDRYPTPQAKGYKDCQPCPDPLPANVASVFPGAKFTPPSPWPPLTGGSGWHQNPFDPP